MRFTITLQAEQLKKAISAMRGAVSAREILGSVGETLLRVNRNRHLNNQDPDGNKWKPLSPLTLIGAVQGKNKKQAQSIVRRKTTRMLNQHGDLLRFHYQIIGNEVIIGPNDWNGWKANFHHYGTKAYTITPRKAKALAFAGLVRKRVHHPGLPARRLIGLPDGDKQLIQKVVGGHIREAMGRK